MKLFTKIQLSTMMFFQFFIWGGWWVTLGTFLSKNLNASGIEISTAFSTQSWVNSYGQYRFSWNPLFVSSSF